MFRFATWSVPLTLGGLQAAPAYAQDNTADLAKQLANQIASFAGDDDRADVNAAFLQPVLSYTTPTARTFTARTESTYDWEGEQWSVPVNAVVTKVTKARGAYG